MKIAFRAARSLGLVVTMLFSNQTLNHFEGGLHEVIRVVDLAVKTLDLECLKSVADSSNYVRASRLSTLEGAALTRVAISWLTNR
jgi:hypothetical protein